MILWRVDNLLLWINFVRLIKVCLFNKLIGWEMVVRGGWIYFINGVLL